MHDARLSRFAALAAAGVVALAAGCGGDSGTAPVRLEVVLFATPPSIPVDGTSTIIAQVTTDRGQPATGVSLEWSNTFGSLAVRGSGTDANGRYSVTLRGEGAPGVAVVTARVVGRSEQGQVEVRIGP